MLCLQDAQVVAGEKATWHLSVFIKDTIVMYVGLHISD